MYVMAEIENLMPGWLKEHGHEIFPTIDTALARGLAAPNTQLVVTGEALRRYPQMFQSFESFAETVKDIYSNSEDFAQSTLLRAPRNFPKLLLKVDHFRESVNT